MMSDFISKTEAPDGIPMPLFQHLAQQETQLTAHKAWLSSIKKEQPLPKHSFKVAVYIRYFNQTKHKDYLSYHKKQYLETIALCPNWEFIDFYIDEGQTAPNMESTTGWASLLTDCVAGKVDLIITQKTSNISKKQSELTFCSRLLASLDKPVGIYFISEDIFTLASYYQEDLHDPFFLPSADWNLLPDETFNLEALHD